MVVISKIKTARGQLTRLVFLGLTSRNIYPIEWAVIVW